MQYQENDKNILRRYLLCDLDEETRIEIESRLLLDNDYNDQLRIVEDELIDDYVCGDLPSPLREKFEKHTLLMPEIPRKVRIREAIDGFASLSSQSEARRNAAKFSLHLLSFIRKLRWQPIAGLAVIVISLGIGAYWLLVSQSELRKGMTALNEAYSQERPLEPRISALNHAPYSVKRGSEMAPLIGQRKLALDRAARIFLDLVSEKAGPTSYHAAGRYYLTQKDYAQAIDQFNSALNAEKARPQLDHEEKSQLQNDYAVALMEKAKSEKEKDPVKYELGMAESREHLYEAQKLNEKSPEAQFNLGLWLQERRLWKQAEEAWNKYLEKDSSSPWADEARKYREIAIEEAKKQISLTPQELLQEFLNAYHSNDKAKAWQILRQNREPITERLVWWQLAGAFLNAAKTGLNDQADDPLRALAYAGELELEKGDHFTSELAVFYRSSTPQQHVALIQAHELIRQGHAFWLKSKYDTAFENYSNAERLFEQSGDTWEARLAELMIGYCYLQMTKLEESLPQLQQLERICESKKYRSLQVQALCALGAVHFAQAEYSKSNTITRRALEVAELIGETVGAQKSLAQLANQHNYLDDFHQSLAILHRCLQSVNNGWPGGRQMWRTYDTLAQALNALHFYAAAADFQKESLDLGLKEFQDPSQISVSYVHLASIFKKLQNYNEAITLAQLGFKSSQSSSRRMPGYALLQLGHIYRESGDVERALENYDQSVNRLAEVDDQVRIYDAYKGRLLCYLSQGNDAAASGELQQVLSLAQKYRSKIVEEKHRNTFFDAEQSVYDIAIDFEYSRRGNKHAAFEYSEASRARSLLDLINANAQIPGKKSHPMALPSVTEPLTLDQIQKNLSQQAQIVQYAVLEDKLLIWVVTQNSFEIVEEKISLSGLRDRVDSYWGVVSSLSIDRENEANATKQAKELYEILIAPLEARNLLDKKKSVCIVPDKVLNYLPFNALVSTKTGRYIIDEYHLTFAPSANVYLRCSEWALQRSGKTDESLLSLGNPSFDRQAFPLENLPASEREANNVASFYQHSSVFLGPNAREAIVKSKLAQFDALHLASHYVVDEHSSLLSKLLLAKEPVSPGDQDGVLRAEEIYQQRPLRARLVVLSACRSGVERYYNGEGMIGMSRAFIASGVPLVVASLWPVDSEATSELMVAFHRHRKQDGLTTAEALRRAQLEMSNGSSQQYRHPSYWASFIVIGGYASF